MRRGRKGKGRREEKPGFIGIYSESYIIMSDRLTATIRRESPPLLNLRSDKCQYY